MSSHNRRFQAGFSLIELLVVISIIAILIGIALPAMSIVRTRAVKVACSSNLRQIGIAVQAYVDKHQGVYPDARYMPLPFISSETKPGLPRLLEPYFVDVDSGEARKIYHCQGDQNYVYAISGTSYYYEPALAGRTLEESFMVRFMKLSPSDVNVSRDFDNGIFDVVGGQVSVPPFHDLRNLLFADGHVGNFN